MTRHTPETYRDHKISVERDGNGELAFWFGEHNALCCESSISQVDREETARRMAACYNALPGIPTEALENGAVAAFIAAVRKEADRQAQLGGSATRNDALARADILYAALALLTKTP